MKQVEKTSTTSIASVGVKTPYTTSLVKRGESPERKRPTVIKVFCF